MDLLLIDARLDNNLHELYETRTGGESWSMKQASASPIPFPAGRQNNRRGVCVLMHPPIASTLKNRTARIGKRSPAFW